MLNVEGKRFEFEQHQQAAVNHFPRGEIGSCCSQLSRICPVRALICFHWIYTARLALTSTTMWSANPIITRVNGYKLDKYTIQTQNSRRRMEVFLGWTDPRWGDGKQSFLHCLERREIDLWWCSYAIRLNAIKNEEIWISFQVGVKTNKRRK